MSSIVIEVDENTKDSLVEYNEWFHRFRMKSYTFGGWNDAEYNDIFIRGNKNTAAGYRLKFLTFPSQNEYLEFYFKHGNLIYSNRIFYISNKFLQNIKFKIKNRKYMKKFTDVNNWLESIYNCVPSHMNNRRKQYWLFKDTVDLIQFLKDQPIVLTL